MLALCTAGYIVTASLLDVFSVDGAGGGAVIGAVMDNGPIGIAIGIAIGAAVGAASAAYQRRR